jgi:2-polyprenyl-3-methyl-5-hydroxy-6-metoxy-1,4-benzoquinol methylase
MISTTGAPLSELSSRQTSEPLVERTVPKLHAALMDFVGARFARQSTILDLGCGTGAWVERLRRNGFLSTWAVDQDPDSYAGSCPFTVVDLDADFAASIQSAFAKNSFDLITCIEVIEHLESTANFLRCCRRMLGPNGSLLMTTPNVLCAPGRLKFAFKGELRHFDQHGNLTHITPIFPRLLKRLAEAEGLAVELVSPVPSRSSFRGTASYKALLARAISLLTQGESRGDCLLFLLRKK